jgi:transposase
MRFAGIDVGSRTHVVVVVCGETQDVLVKPTAFSEDAAGYERLCQLLGSPNDLLVAMEATGIYGRNLFLVLCERSYRVALVNPLRTRRFAQEDLKRAKSDSIDALGIACFAAQKRPEVTTPFDENTAQLREYVRLFDRFTQDYGDRRRQLHRAVHLCFPEFTRHVRGSGSQRASAILAAYPTAEDFWESCLPELAEIRYDGRHPVTHKLAKTLLEAAKCSVARNRGPAFRAEIRYLCHDLERLRVTLKELRLEIDRRLEEHPLAPLLATIDGLGTTSIARLLAAVGDPARFRNGAAFAAYAGVVPGTRKSGLRRGDRAALCPLGNARLRQGLYMTTLGAVRNNPWLRAFYGRLRANGKLPKVALLAAMRKLLMAVYSVAKHRQPFVPRLPTNRDTTQ